MSGATIRSSGITEEASIRTSVMASLLILDDEPAVLLSLQTFFRRRGFDVETCSTGAEALRALGQRHFDAILLDLILPDANGLDLLREVEERFSDTAVIVMSAQGTIESAVQAIKLGAEDFLTKPFILEEALITLKRTLEIRRLQRQNSYYRGLVDSQLRHEVLGVSPAMDRVRSLICLLADNADTTVLIEGESGVGKGLIARAIHGRSARSRGAYVEVNCSSLSEHLLESELFGHEKGAFTGAFSRKLGLFEVAGGGTLYLDEIADLPLAVQPKLLTALESRTFRRVGGTCDLASNVRLIASANRPLKRIVQEGGFRGDLFYRLNVMAIQIPPLRERIEDVPILAHHYLAELTRMRPSSSQIDASCLEILTSYDWPGNVRELRNVIERAVILAQGEGIRPSHLPRDLVRRNVAEPISQGLPTLEQIEVAHIREAMRAAGLNRSRAARILGIHRTTLLKKLKKYNL